MVLSPTETALELATYEAKRAIRRLDACMTLLGEMADYGYSDRRDEDANLIIDEDRWRDWQQRIAVILGVRPNG